MGQFETNTTAAFTIPEPFEYLEANEFGYASRPKANKVLQRRNSFLLKHKPGRRSNNIMRHLLSLTIRPKTGINYAQNLGK